MADLSAARQAHRRGARARADRARMLDGLIEALTTPRCSTGSSVTSSRRSRTRRDAPRFGARCAASTVRQSAASGRAVEAAARPVRGEKAGARRATRTRPSTRDRELRAARRVASVPATRRPLACRDILEPERRWRLLAATGTASRLALRARRWNDGGATRGSLRARYFSQGARKLSISRQPRGRSSRARTTLSSTTTSVGIVATPKRSTRSGRSCSSTR